MTSLQRVVQIFSGEGHSGYHLKWKELFLWKRSWTKDLHKLEQDVNYSNTVYCRNEVYISPSQSVWS